MYEFVRRMREQQEMMRRVMEGPAKYLRDNEAAITRMQDDLVHGMDTGVLEKRAVVAASASASDFARRLPALVDSTAAAFAKLTTPDFMTAMDHYVREQREMSQTIERLALPHKAWIDHIAAMSSFNEATRFTLPTIDFDRVGGLIAAADLQCHAVARLTDRLLFRHADLIESLSQPGSLLALVPLAVSDLPTVDVFVHTSAVRSITPHEPLEDEDEERAVPLRLTVVTETVMFLEQTLPALKPAFLEQYRGVKARADDRGPDGWTQGSASMRKLLKGVLHSVAPNEVVLPWATKNNKGLDRHGCPTRATKIEWLCHFIPNDAYRAYVQTELNSALALIKLVDTAQHVDEFPEFAGQYDWIMLRAEVAIRHMLALWKLRQTIM